MERNIMVERNTIAKNHFSELSKKGRYGDTEILRFSGGERAHGNIKEKALINMYGQQGEQMVKAAGSGSTNPSTGLPEYFEPVTTTLAVGSLLMGAAGSYTGGKAEQKVFFKKDTVQRKKWLDKIFLWVLRNFLQRQELQEKT